MSSSFGLYRYIIILIKMYADKSKITQKLNQKKKIIMCTFILKSTNLYAYSECVCDIGYCIVIYKIFSINLLLDDDERVGIKTVFCL